MTAKPIKLEKRVMPSIMVNDIKGVSPMSPPNEKYFYKWDENWDGYPPNPAIKYHLMRQKITAVHTFLVEWDDAVKMWSRENVFVEPHMAAKIYKWQYLGYFVEGK